MTPQQPRGPSRPRKYPKKEASAQVVFEDEELRELQAKQMHVGVTLGRMGCVLANDTRRQAFLDDEDFEDEILTDGEEDEDEAEGR
jgi:hypothetical protein